VQVDVYVVPPDISGRNALDERCRSHNPEVAGSNPAPAPPEARVASGNPSQLDPYVVTLDAQRNRVKDRPAPIFCVLGGWRDLPPNLIF
jgi:hypothetical protein